MFLLFGLLACQDPPPPPVEKPDVVLILVDTLRADRLGLYGADRPTSPQLDAQGAQGLVFERAYAQSGWTLPSVTSLFTGQYFHEHKVGRDLARPDVVGCLGRSAETLAEAMAARGYATGAVINNTFLAPEFGLRQGFDHYDYQGATNEVHRSAADSVAAGLSWLGTQTKPAFLVVHLMEPHLDYRPDAAVRGLFAPVDAVPDGLDLADPAAFTRLQQVSTDPPAPIKDYVKALYDEELRSVDNAVGALTAGVAARGRPTVFAFTADHGEEHWDHGGFEHGHALWSELTRVPMVLWGPGIAVGRSSTLVEHLDLFHTLLTVAGATPPAGSHGSDLRTLGDEPRVALSENCLYAAPCVSLVDREARLRFFPVEQHMDAWAIDDAGHDAAPIEGEALRATVQRMGPQLQALRGTLEPVNAIGNRQLDSALFAQLAALGYMDGVPAVADVPAESDPCGGATPPPPPPGSGALPDPPGPRPPAPPAR